MGWSRRRAGLVGGSAGRRGGRAGLREDGRRIGHLPTRARPIADAEGERSGSTVDEVILGLRASMAAGSDSCEDQQGLSRAITGNQGGGLRLM